MIRGWMYKSDERTSEHAISIILSNKLPRTWSAHKHTHTETNNFPLAVIECQSLSLSTSGKNTVSRDSPSPLAAAHIIVTQSLIVYKWFDEVRSISIVIFFSCFFFLSLFSPSSFWSLLVAEIVFFFISFEWNWNRCVCFCSYWCKCSWLWPWFMVCGMHIWTHEWNIVWVWRNFLCFHEKNILMTVEIIKRKNGNCENNTYRIETFFLNGNNGEK